MIFFSLGLTLISFQEGFKEVDFVRLTSDILAVCCVDVNLLVGLFVRVVVGGMSLLGASGLGRGVWLLFGVWGEGEEGVSALYRLDVRVFVDRVKTGLEKQLRLIIKIQ